MAAPAPVVGEDRLVAIGPRASFLALDHDALAGLGADEQEQDGSRDGGTFEEAPRLVETGARLEDLTQQMFGRQASAAPQAVQRVQRVVEPQQHRTPPAAAHRRLVDRGGEAPRRHRGQHADETGPGDVQELPARAALAPHLDEAAETGKRPVERAAESRALLALVAERGAAKEIGAVQQPDARLLQGAGDDVDLGGVGRP